MSTTAWDLSRLRTHLRSADTNFDLANEFLRTIGQDVAIFRYHMTMARDALKGLVDEEHPVGQENFLLVFGGSEKSDEFNYAHIVSEAHLISCLHTARDMWDHFAQLLNLVLLESSIPIHLCDISRVSNCLPDSALRDYVSTTLSSHWYKYVAAFVNTAKHRRLVKHLFSVSIEENRAGVRVGAFSYKDKDEPFPEYWGTEALGCVLN